MRSDDAEDNLLTLCSDCHQCSHGATSFAQSNSRSILCVRRQPFYNRIMEGCAVIYAQLSKFEGGLFELAAHRANWCIISKDRTVSCDGCVRYLILRHRVQRQKVFETLGVQFAFLRIGITGGSVGLTYRTLRASRGDSW